MVAVLQIWICWGRWGTCIALAILLVCLSICALEGVDAHVGVNFFVYIVLQNQCKCWTFNSYFSLHSALCSISVIFTLFWFLKVCRTCKSFLSCSIKVEESYLSWHCIIGPVPDGSPVCPKTVWGTRESHQQQYLRQLRTDQTNTRCKFNRSMPKSILFCTSGYFCVSLFLRIRTRSLQIYFCASFYKFVQMKIHLQNYTYLISM